MSMKISSFFKPVKREAPSEATTPKADVTKVAKLEVKEDNDVSVVMKDESTPSTEIKSESVSVPDNQTMESTPVASKLKPSPFFSKAVPKTADSATKTAESTVSTVTLNKNFAPQIVLGSKLLTDPNFDPLAFNIEDYVAPSGGLTYQLLTDAYDDIALLKGSGTGSAKLIATILCNMLRTIIVHSPQDLAPALYLTLNKVAPDYEGLELNIGDQIITKVISQSFNRDPKDIKADLAAGRAQDLGEVAFNSRSRQNKLAFSAKQQQRLTISGVLKSFKEVAHTTGSGSQDTKAKLIQKVLLVAQGSEVKFVVRSLQRKMRIGVASLSLLSALSYAFVLSRPAVGSLPAEADVRLLKTGARLTDEASFEEKKKSFEAAVRAAFCEQPSLDHLAARLLAGDEEELLAKNCTIGVGVPVQPMLAKPTKGVGEVLDRFANTDFTCEFKYDGERAQVHYRKGTPLAVYSRNSENLTGKYPDLLEGIEQALEGSSCTSLVLDCEAVAYDVEKDQILPFQELIKRKRKDVKIEDIKVRVCLFAFDCMLLNDESLLQRPFLERRTLLRQNLKEIPGKFLYAIGTDVFLTKKSEEGEAVLDPSEHIQQALDAAVIGNCEGLMVKTLTTTATYEPSKRSFKWLKVKKDYVDGMTDSLDVIPIGAFHGRGKRAGMFGAYLLAVWNPDQEVYETCCKIGTGFSDDFLLSSTSFFSDKTTSQKPNNYVTPSDLVPDVWLEPCQVWEIKGADMTISPRHTAAYGLVAADKGVGIRFPRFLRIRDDKGVQDISNSQQIADMYNAQFAHLQQANIAAMLAEDEEDEDM